MTLQLKKYNMVVLLIIFCSLKVKAQNFLGSYFNDLDFLNSAAMLEPNLISKSKIDFNTSFDVQTETLYYTISSAHWSEFYVMQSQFKNGKFSKLENVMFGNQLYNSADVHIQSNGKYLYFVRENGNIWKSQKINHQWSTHEELPETINSSTPEAYQNTTNNGNLYFAGFSGGSNYDIYEAKYNNEKYKGVTKFPNTFNTNLLDSDAWLSPDYEYLCLTSTRNSPNPQQLDGELDLYFAEFNVNDSIKCTPPMPRKFIAKPSTFI